MLQRDAADILELSVRQVQRLVRLYRTDGATAFASSRRGRPANNRIDEETRCKALDLIRCHYSDFGPTLATEKLAERHHIHLSVETVRNWMTADGLWRPHSRRRTRVYQPRYRRDCLGELVQIDGSHHDWFEGRAPKCCLLVFMDDATGRLMHLRFCDSENAFDCQQRVKSDPLTVTTNGLILIHLVYSGLASAITPAFRFCFSR